MVSKLIFIELNEVNFDMANFYIKSGEDLPGFKKLNENVSGLSDYFIKIDLFSTLGITK